MSAPVGGQSVKHLVFVQFDNVHFRRDLPNVPSDLEKTEFGGQYFDYTQAAKLTVQSYALLADLYVHTHGNIPLLP